MMGVIPETCRAKNTLIKLPCCTKLAFQVISEECSFVHSLLWTFYNSGLHLLTQFYEETKRD